MKCKYCVTYIDNNNDTDKISENKNSLIKVCKKCEKYKSTYGEPIKCNICQLKAAFKNDRCIFCICLSKKYNTQPVPCRSCGMIRAFPREDHSDEKKPLCRICFINSSEKRELKRRCQSIANEDHVSKKLKTNDTNIDTMNSAIIETLTTEEYNSFLEKRTKKLEIELQLKEKELQLLKELHSTEKSDYVQEILDLKNKSKTLKDIIESDTRIINELKMKLKSIEGNLLMSTYSIFKNNENS
uniref:Stc1 domain-containing protein n=1 Tax=Parastrongyloides trichosuri TaxID=131310 RepID=A0A0N5A5D5_PARTI